MHSPRIFLFLVFVISGLCARAQTKIFDIGGPKFLNVKNELPEDLTSQRSLVIISTPVQEKSGYQVRGDWQKLAVRSHKFLRQIGVDPIGYVYIDDLNAGPEVKFSFLNLMRTRKVTNLVLITKTGELPNEEFSIMVTPFSESENGYLSSGQDAWNQSHHELEQVMVNLGRQVLRQEIERSNFLIPEVPEYISDFAVIAGTRFENYPSRIQNYKIAVVAFQKLTPQGQLSADAQAEVNYFNNKVDQKNALLVEILKKYPFKYELVNIVDSEELYKQGFQYVMLPLQSTGRSIKRILNFSNSDSETHQMSTTYKMNGEVELKKIPANANLTKFYIKQTAVNDIHVGEVWDADVSWDLSLYNFVENINKAFIK